MSLEQYNQIMKAAHDAGYLAMVDRSTDQLLSGNGKQHELIEVDDEEAMV